MASILNVLYLHISVVNTKRGATRHYILGVIIAFPHTPCSMALTFYLFLRQTLFAMMIARTHFYILVHSVKHECWYFYVDKIINADIKNSWHALSQVRNLPKQFNCWCRQQLWRWGKFQTYFTCSMIYNLRIDISFQVIWINHFEWLCFKPRKIRCNQPVMISYDKRRIFY